MDEIHLDECPQYLKSFVRRDLDVTYRLLDVPMPLIVFLVQKRSLRYEKVYELT